MEKAIEIKRRAQRCIQNNDLEGALREYEKLVGGEESDPYNHVLLADLLYRKGDQTAAAERYLEAVVAYEKASLYKNAIAVCKKLMRLSLAPTRTLKHLASLHALDGLNGEASLYHVQYAELMVRGDQPAEAVVALRAAFDVCQDNVRVLEQLAEAYVLAEDPTSAARALQEAAGHYRSRGLETDAHRVLGRAQTLDPTTAATPMAERAPLPVAEPEPSAEPVTSAPAELELDPTHHAFDAAAANAPEGFERGRISPLPFAAPEAGTIREVPGVPEAHAVPEVSEAPVEPPRLVAPGTPEPIASDDPVQVWSQPGTPESADADDDEAEEPAGVYAIEIDETESNAESTYVIEERSLTDADVPEPDQHRTDAPGLSFATADETAMSSARVEALLARAQEQFRAGEREQASATLADAAAAYESLGRMDSAATIYRSLGRGAQASAEVLARWLANCEARGDSAEAAQVACELGDRLLNEGDTPGAGAWFERALAFEPGHETATRRLARISGAPAPAPAASPAPAGDAAASEPGRVEVAVGRAEAVTFDLGGLLAEFQRGVQAQLSGDAQSHYDLGMTYREMGLLEQAVESFRVAEMDGRLTARALEMVGRCFTDMGRWGEASVEFGRALECSGLDPVAAAELRYHHGLALAHSADPLAALREFEQVAAVIPGYEDVDERIASLREQLGKAA